MGFSSIISKMTIRIRWVKGHFEQNEMFHAFCLRSVESSVDPNVTPVRPVQSPDLVSKCFLISSFNHITVGNVIKRACDDLLLL